MKVLLRNLWQFESCVEEKDVSTWNTLSARKWFSLKGISEWINKWKEQRFPEEVQLFYTLTQSKGVSAICPFPWLYTAFFFPKKIVGDGNCSGKALNKFQWIILTYINHQPRHWYSQRYGVLPLIWCNESDNLLWSPCQKIRILF